MNTRYSKAKKTKRIQGYRKRVKKSYCRGLGRATCRRTSGCKQATGTKRKFCRKSKNQRM